MLTKSDFTANGFSEKQAGEWTVKGREIGLNDAFLERCCTNPKDETTGFHPVTCGKASEVYRFEFDGRVFYFKEFLSRGWTDRVKDMFRGCRALRALEGELALNSAGLNSPPILVIGTRNRRNFMVTEEVPDAISLYFMVTHPEKFPIAPHRFMVELGHLIGTLHANGISHGDLRWGNVLLNGSGKDLTFYFIDNERTVKYGSLPDRLRFKNLVQLNMNGHTLSNYLILRFYVSYLQHNPEVRGLKDEIAMAVANKTIMRLKRLEARSRNN